MLNHLMHSNSHHQRSKLHTRRACLIVLFALLGVLCIFTGCSFLHRKQNLIDFPITDFDAASFNRPLLDNAKNDSQLSFEMPYEAAWRQHAHLVVFGVLGMDSSKRRPIRHNQRSTWLQYPDVATRSNAFKGLMLVLYPACPRVSRGSVGVFKEIAEEMHTHHDVLMLRMKEEVSTRTDVLVREGYYDIRADVSMTRKTLLYMLYAYNAFPGAPFIAKGDDDSYVYVPEYLRMLRQLPRINTIYGAVSKDRKHYAAHHPRRKALGMGYTVTRDILREAVSEPTVNELLIQPYSPSLNERYLRAYFHHEDAVIGKALDRLKSLDHTTQAVSDSVSDEDDPRLPAVEGWGRAYMAYVRDPQHVPHTGGAANGDSRYVLTYSFPEPNKLRAGSVLWVNDKHRIKEHRLPDLSGVTTRTIIANHVVTAEEYQLHWDYHELVGEDAKMQRPYHIAVRAKEYFSDASLLGVGSSGSAKA